MTHPYFLKRSGLFLFITGCFFLFAGKLSAQTVFWTEDFGLDNNCSSQAMTASSYSGVNGPWTISLPTANGTSANDWCISATEAGMGLNNCGDGCLSNSALTNRSLHVCNIAGSPSSIFCSTGDCGAAYDAGVGNGVVVTDKRAESPTINCAAQTGITLNFLYMEGGQTTIDNMTVWYFDGATWSQLSDPPKTLTCPGGQGKWTASGAIALPASADNNPSVKIGFRWVNNDDGSGSDPSTAIDDVTLSGSSAAAPPNAAFSSTDTSFCVNQAVNFNDLSTGNPTSWAWTFPGGSPASATTQNVTGVTWNTPGTYTVTLTATNANGSTNTTLVITVNAPPTVTATANPSVICVGQQSALTGSGASTYVWNPGNISGSPVNVTPASTTTYTVTGTSAAGCTGTGTVTVTVQPCSVPSVWFVASDSVLCVGDCISFTDQSTNNPTSWNWSFSGASTATSTQQNPTNICYPSPGSYAVTLIATNASGSGSQTFSGYINVNAAPVADAGNNATICVGQQTTLVGSGGVSFNWQPGNQSSNTIVVTPAVSTTYTLTVTDANGCTGTDQVTVTVTNCTVPTAALSVSDNSICESSCISFTDNSTGAPTGWSWSFPGGTPSSSTAQNPSNICYNTPGTYPVVLIVTNAFGSDTITMTNYVTVGAQPTVDAGPYTTIAIGNSTQLNPTGGGSGSWAWTPSFGLSSSTVQSPVASPTVTTTYTVSYTDSYGCTSSDTVTVNVIEAYSIFIPSAFSPNGDGANDVLFVRGAGIKTLEFVVYDRWGEKVFESQSINDGWDGTFRDKEMNTGIYVYYATAVFYNGTSQQLKGDVSLVR